MKWPYIFFDKRDRANLIDIVCQPPNSFLSKDHIGQYNDIGIDIQDQRSQPHTSLEKTFQIKYKPKMILDFSFYLLLESFSWIRKLKLKYIIDSKLIITVAKFLIFANCLQRYSLLRVYL